MLSYQHAFHAGNHADVLKHTTLCAIIRAITLKPKPFFYLDTHAGNGCYELDAQSHQDEVAALLLTDTSGEPQVVSDYKQVLKSYTNKTSYPGSPLIALDMLTLLADEREQSLDILGLANIHFNELHPSGFASLKQWTANTHAHCHKRDGFEVLNALTPPTPNRGVVLIDPPYEQVSEYDEVFTSVSNALKKWNNGIFCVWYPLLSPTRIDRVSGDIVDTPKHGFSEQMLTLFIELASAMGIGLTDIQFANQVPSHETGMYGSGMVIFNPPWKLNDTLSELLLHLENNVQKETNTLSGVSILVPAP